MFTGSYRPQDVEFLLKPITVEFSVDLARKEALIQSGERHYSEMLSSELAPSGEYLALFHRAHAMNRDRLARDCLLLARLLVEHYGRDFTVVSLARAGTPIGVIVLHLSRKLFGGCPSHYSISIIRDRGIDTIALKEILGRGHRPESIAFVDGWTGKGVISRELSQAVADFNQNEGTRIDPGLNVLTDLAGSAARAASGDDYLIASSILNSTISGLVSRSILNAAIGPSDYHGCVFFDQFAPYDLSRWFVDDVVQAALACVGCEETPQKTSRSPADQSAVSRAYMRKAMGQFGVADENLIKPGIGEATRVLLRRVPERVLVRNALSSRVAHLIALALEKNVPIEEDASLPYHAVSIIKSVSDV